MSQQEIVSTVTELQELRRMQEELAAEVEALQDRIKDHMTAQGLETLTAGTYKVSYKAVTSSRLDMKALKNALPDVVERFSKLTTAKRFTVQ